MGGVLAGSASITLSPEGRDRRLAIALGHVEIASAVGGDVLIVVCVASAQGEGCELSTPHVRFQLLQRKRPISTSHVRHLLEVN